MRDPDALAPRRNYMTTIQILNRQRLRGERNAQQTEIKRRSKYLMDKNQGKKKTRIMNENILPNAQQIEVRERRKLESLVKEYQTWSFS